ncbi:hypothetical protein GW16_01115 [Xanthomonas arboricola pv. celebensis]|nr:hypothetical protein GW16_01115 [Xanthomonas arboricola pv. celebensis]
MHNILFILVRVFCLVSEPPLLDNCKAVLISLSELELANESISFLNTTDSILSILTSELSRAAKRHRF